MLDNSTMTMSAGSITNNSGTYGVINVYNNSKFNMSGGSITNNTGTSVGSVVGTFTHTGGTISGNKPK